MQKCWNPLKEISYTRNTHIQWFSFILKVTEFSVNMSIVCILADFTPRIELNFQKHRHHFLQWVLIVRVCKSLSHVYIHVDLLYMAARTYTFPLHCKQSNLDLSIPHSVQGVYPLPRQLGQGSSLMYCPFGPNQDPGLGAPELSFLKLNFTN